MVDILRSCYQADMHAWSEDPDRSMQVRWYFADDDAPMMPFSTVFGSRNWEIPEPPLPALGEAESPRPWRNGHPPYPVSFGGLCGSRESWQGGITTADDVPPPTWPGSLVPRCCVAPPNQTAGGIAWGGEVSIVSAREGIAWGGTVLIAPPLSGCCAYIEPVFLRLTCVSVSGSCSAWLSTDVVMAWDGIANWRSLVDFNPPGDSFGPYRAEMRCHPIFDPIQGYVLVITNDLGDGFTQSGDGIFPDCRAATYHGEVPMDAVGGTCGGSGTARFRMVAL